MIYKSYLAENNIKVLDKNLITFYGENLGLINDFKNKIIEYYSDYEVIRFSQEEIMKNKDMFFGEISNISLFEKNKTFLIENVSDKILEILKELDTFDLVNRKIYLFAATLEKKSKLRVFLEKSQKYGVVACYPDNEIGIRKIIQEKLKDYKGINQNTINIILENCNLDRIKLNNEIEKIKACFLNKIIDPEKLQNLLDTRINDDFNALKNAAIAGDLVKTNKLLSDTTIEEEKNVFYLYSINQTFGRLMDICDSKNEDIERAIEEVKPPIFWKDKPIFKSQVKLWDRIKIRKILDESYKIEKLTKSNASIKKSLLLKKMILDICFTANS